jgi:Tfp pilus assembly protein PilZ
MYGDKQFPLFMRSGEWNDEEKRLHPRLPCFLLVDYATHDSVYRDFITNISVGGAFIESPTLPIGPEIMMAFSFLDDHNPIKIIGEVTWICQEGIGVKFKLRR